MLLRYFPALLLFFCVQAWAAERPNVLVILADDLGYSDLGCYGGEMATPQLDRLAAGGVRFTQFYNTARCWPTRAAIMTGYYPQQVGMDPPVKAPFPAWVRTLPQMLRPLGYRSYHSGKWHVHRAAKVCADGGFDHSYHLMDQDRHFGPRRAELDDVAQPAVSPESGYYSTTKIADHAIQCLREHAANHAGKPFFSYVAFTVPHFPIQAPPEDIARCREKYRAGWEAVRAARFERQKKSGLVNCPLSPIEPQIVAPSGKESDLEILGPGELRTAKAWDALTEEQREFQATKFAIHAAMVERMDREIGRIVAQLGAMGALENTAIFFLSDNGASAEVMVRGDGHDRTAAPGSAATYLCLGPGGSTVANTPFRRHKIWVHEGGIATPLIVHWPAGFAARGELRHAPGHAIDFAPTLLEMAGAKAAATEGAPPLPGRSLVPALAADRPIERDAIFFHHSGNRALRVGDWKLVSAATDGDAWELYDLATDRAETKNLAATHPDRVREMSAQWQRMEEDFVRQAGPPK